MNPFRRLYTWVSRDHERCGTCPHWRVYGSGSTRNLGVCWALQTPSGCSPMCWADQLCIDLDVREDVEVNFWQRCMNKTEEN